jgi:hypothetical protein
MALGDSTPGMKRSGVEVDRTPPVPMLGQSGTIPSLPPYIFSVFTKTALPYRYASLNEGYVPRNASLGDFVVVRTCTYTNLDSIAYYTP